MQQTRKRLRSLVTLAEAILCFGPAAGALVLAWFAAPLLLFDPFGVRATVVNALVLAGGAIGTCGAIALTRAALRAPAPLRARRLLLGALCSGAAAAAAGMSYWELRPLWLVIMPLAGFAHFWYRIRSPVRASSALRPDDAGAKGVAPAQLGFEYALVLGRAVLSAVMVQSSLRPDYAIPPEVSRAGVEGAYGALLDEMERLESIDDRSERAQAEAVLRQVVANDKSIIQVRLEVMPDEEPIHTAFLYGSVPIERAGCQSDRRSKADEGLIRCRARSGDRVLDLLRYQRYGRLGSQRPYYSSLDVEYAEATARILGRE